MLERLRIESLSGLAAGIATTLVTHPLDVIKVRLQLDADHRRGAAWRGVLRLLQPTAASPHLVLNLYRGVLPSGFGNAVAWSMYFTAYREFQSWTPGPLSTLANYACAFGAGATTALVTNPVWVIKTRMLALPRGASGAYPLVRAGVLHIWRHEGLGGFWRGSAPALVAVAQGALQVTTYEHLKQWVNPDSQAHLSTLQYLYTSAASKMLSASVFYPVQLVRARLQALNTPLAALATTRLILQREGLRGFYKGVGPNLLRVVPATMVTFLVYEKTKHWLGRWAV